MGSLFRSEDMLLCQLLLQAETAYRCISELGELGIIQFKDLNLGVNAFKRKFVNEIRRCEEMERQLRYFEQELKHEGLTTVELMSNPEAPIPRDMVDLEATYENLESELRELNTTLEALKRNYQELKELRYVLIHTEDFFQESSLSVMSDESRDLPSQAAHGDIELNHFSQPSDEERRTQMAGRMHSRYYLSYVTGVLARERLPGFMRLLWFACHGNIYIRHAEIDEPLLDVHTGDPVWKVVFIAFFQGEQLKAKVKKICEGYKAVLYPCSESKEDRNTIVLGVSTRLQDLETVIQKSQEQKLRLLSTVSQNWESWNVKVLKIKAIYHIMNMFHTEGKNYIAECFVPAQDLDRAQMTLNHATEQAGSSAPSIVHPIPVQEELPTFNRTNKFTKAFQHIIDAYGMANYKEVNPTPFAIITFPFIFSVMFGDFGHGFLMLLFALWMVLREDHLQSLAKKSEIFSIIFAGRYIVLLMGVFSMYSGLLYNDCFSKSFKIFNSGWSTKHYVPSTLVEHRELQLDPADNRSWLGNPYPFGTDPIWQFSLNKISYTNSFKKKISVIFGVSQMLLGVILSIWNHVFFKQYLRIFCEFIPQMIFLMSIFGYLCSLIFVKWVSFSDPNCSPNILIGFINMFLFKYNKNDVCSNRTWYSGQQIVQTFLVIIALVCALWMLLLKPIIIHVRSRKLVVNVHISDHADIQQGAEPDDISEIAVDVDDIPIVSSHNDDAEQLAFGEMFIHQAIHTIEYCLGCVSHTASYLRLWALSLAHSQLSEVLWKMVMQRGTKAEGYVGIPMMVVVIVPFAFLTVAILLLMEGLSAFLHTLRLHWVEFQSKFYTGDGIIFHPFGFKEILEKGFE